MSRCRQKPVQGRRRTRFALRTDETVRVWKYGEVKFLHSFAEPETETRDPLHLCVYAIGMLILTAPQGQQDPWSSISGHRIQDQNTFMVGKHVTDARGDMQNGSRSRTMLS